MRRLFIPFLMLLALAAHAAPVGVHPDRTHQAVEQFARYHLQRQAGVTHDGPAIVAGIMEIWANVGFEIGIGSLTIVPSLSIGWGDSELAE
jgi:hypothetical protein